MLAGPFRLHVMLLAVHTPLSITDSARRNSGRRTAAEHTIILMYCSAKPTQRTVLPFASSSNIMWNTNVAIGTGGTAHKHKAFVTDTGSEKSHEVSIAGHAGTCDVIMKKDAFHHMSTYQIAQPSKPKSIGS